MYLGWGDSGVSEVKTRSSCPENIPSCLAVESQCPSQVISPEPPCACLHIWLQLWEVEGSMKYTTTFSAGEDRSLEEGAVLGLELADEEKASAGFCF